MSFLNRELASFWSVTCLLLLSGCSEGPKVKSPSLAANKEASVEIPWEFDAPAELDTDRETSDDRYRRINHAAMIRKTPGERNIDQDTYDSPDEALDDYILSLFVADEERFAAVAGENVWNQFYSDIKATKNSLLSYLDHHPWRSEMVTMYSRHWSLDGAKRYPVEMLEKNKAVVLSTCEYVLGGEKYKKFVEIGFRAANGRWRISSRTVGDTADLAAERLNRNPVPHPDAALFADLKKRTACILSPRLIGGGGVYLRLDDHVMQKGRVNPEVLKSIEKLRYVSAIEAGELSDDGFNELLPVLQTVHEIELNCSRFTQTSIDKIGSLKPASWVKLHGGGNEKVSRFPFGSLPYLEKAEITGFRGLDANAFDTWKRLKEFRELAASQLKGLNDASFSFLRECSHFDEFNVMDPQNWTIE